MRLGCLLTYLGSVSLFTNSVYRSGGWWEYFCYSNKIYCYLPNSFSQGNTKSNSIQKTRYITYGNTSSERKDLPLTCLSTCNIILNATFSSIGGSIEKLISCKEKMIFTSCSWTKVIVCTFALNKYFVTRIWLNLMQCATWIIIPA